MSCRATSSSRPATASRSRAKAAATGPGDPTQRESEDDFRFVLSREEFLDLFFEDLELPDMVKLNLKEIVAFKPRRAGFTMTGSPTNINVGRTMRNSYGRRIALQAAQAARAGRDCRRTRDT